MMARNPVDRLNELVWSDTLERRGLPGRIAATVLRYSYAVLRDFFSGQLTLRAMSLVYTTLLSIVPVIAVSFSVLKGLGIHRELETRMYLLLEPLGDKGKDITDGVMRLVENVNGVALASVGVAFFIYTAISMVQKIDESFNYVWYAGSGRSFGTRISEYLLVMLIGPVVIATALGMLTSLRSQKFVQFLIDNEFVGPLFLATSKLTPFLLVIAVFTFLYMFMPNTKVRFRAALIGGLGGGFLWASMVLIFTTFVVNAARTEAVYASFAIAIVALIWLYLNWLILLIGAQLAFYVQNPAYLQIGRREPRLSNSMRERLALNIMLLVAKAHRYAEKRLNVQSLSQKLAIPPVTLEPIIHGLEANALLAKDEKNFLLPGREMARTSLADILDVVRGQGETGSHQAPHWSKSIDALGSELDDAILATIGSTTLSDLLDSAESRSTAGDRHPVDEERTAADPAS